MLVALTVKTGVVDATSYLKLGHVFVANMTGNIVFLGFAIAGASGLSVAGSLIALAAFLLGARLGGVVGVRLASHRGRLVRNTVTTQAGLVIVALVIAVVSGTPESSPTRYAITAVLAVTMGIQNSTSQRVAVPELTTTVLTRTLTGLASDWSGPLRIRRIVSVGAMLLGAFAGALLVLHVSIPAALALAAVLSGGVAVAAHLASSDDAPWDRP